MAFQSIVDLSGTAGQSNFGFAFPYISRDHIHVYLDGVETTAFTFNSDFVVHLTTPLVISQTVRVRRITPSAEPLVDFVNGATLGELDLDTTTLQMLYVVQEAQDLQIIDISSSLRVPEEIPLMAAASARANNFLYFDANGDPTVQPMVGTTLAFTPLVQLFSGTGAQTVFTLSSPPGAAAALIVSLSGVVQKPNTDFTLAGSTLTFTTAPAVGANNIAVQNFGVAREVSTVPSSGIVGQIPSTQVDYLPGVTGGVLRLQSNKNLETVSATDFGAVGNGVANDGTAINAAITYVMTNGGILYIPKGTYMLPTGLLYTAAAQPFYIQGAGAGRTILKRSVDHAASVLEIRDSNDWSISDLTIDGNHTAMPNGNHGLAMRDCNRMHLRRVFVRDYKNTAIIGFPLTDGVATHGDNTFVDCQADGVTLANLGIMVASQYRTRIINCVAKNIATAGNPGYGIQFKNNCRNCVMINPMVFTSRMGIVSSNDRVSADDAYDNQVYGGYSYNALLTGIDIAGVHRTFVNNVRVDMNNQGNDACTFDVLTDACQASIISVNVASSKGSFKYVATANDCVGHVLDMSNLTSGAINFAGIVLAGALRNRTILEKVSVPTTVTSASILFSNGADSTNTFESLDVPLRSAVTIATGAFPISHVKQKFFLVDTEAAAATDDLDTISGGGDYQIITLHTSNNARDVVVKHNTGNIVLTGAVDFTLNNTLDTVTLMYRAALSRWVEVGRGDNGA